MRSATLLLCLLGSACASKGAPATAPPAAPDQAAAPTSPVPDAAEEQADEAGPSAEVTEPEDDAAGGIEDEEYDGAFDGDIDEEAVESP